MVEGHLSILLSGLFLGAKFCGVLVILGVIRGLVWLANLLLFAPPSDPLRRLQGPDGSFWEKHLGQTMDPNVSPVTHEQWVGQYGSTWRFHGFGAFDLRLMTFDFRALSHILNSPIYEKPWQTRKMLSKLLGWGISIMEGKVHKWQRKLIGLAFTNQTVRSVSPIFLQKAEELRDCLDKELHYTGSKIPYQTSPSRSQGKAVNNTTEVKVIDIYHWASRAAFDVIGLAGFDYTFNSLNDDDETVRLAFRRIFQALEKGAGFKSLLSLWFPVIETLLPDESLKLRDESLMIIRAAGKRLIARKKAAILAEKSCAQDIQDRDLLSLLIKSNMSEDPSKRMSDPEIVDQLTTFLFAGSDTTSLAISWCIHLLSLNIPAQDRLRQELLALGGPAFDASSASNSDVIESSAYLDAVVRETLRLCPPIHSTIRVATKDDVIPISKPVMLRDGSVTSEIKIRKGSYVHIPIEGLNTSKDIWGQDAHEFNPDRWIKGSLPASHPGLANLMTFSLGGHSCPGYKFSILETKFFIGTLIPYFVFEPVEKISKYNSVATRPYVQDKFHLGSQLPVKVSRYSY